MKAAGEMHDKLGSLMAIFNTRWHCSNPAKSYQFPLYPSHWRYPWNQNQNAKGRILYCCCYGCQNARANCYHTVSLVDVSNTLATGHIMPSWGAWSLLHSAVRRWTILNQLWHATVPTILRLLSDLQHKMKVSSTYLNGAINLPSMYSRLHDLMTRFQGPSCSPRILVLSRTQKRIFISKHCIEALQLLELYAVMSIALMIVHGDPVACQVSQGISTSEDSARYTICSSCGNANLTFVISVYWKRDTKKDEKRQDWRRAYNFGQHVGYNWSSH